MSKLLTLGPFEVAEGPRELYRGLAEAVWPYKYDESIIYNDYNVDFNQLQILIELRASWVAPGEHFYHKVFIPRRIEMEPDTLYWYIVESFRAGFRSWRVEPEDNIILGDN